jgi:hypothetical protein
MTRHQHHVPATIVAAALGVAVITMLCVLMLTTHAHAEDGFPGAKCDAFIERFGRAEKRLGIVLPKNGKFENLDPEVFVVRGVRNTQIKLWCLNPNHVPRNLVMVAEFDVTVDLARERTELGSDYLLQRLTYLAHAGMWALTGWTVDKAGRVIDQVIKETTKDVAASAVRGEDPAIGISVVAISPDVQVTSKIIGQTLSFNIATTYE